MQIDTIAIVAGVFTFAFVAGIVVAGVLVRDRPVKKGAHSLTVVKGRVLPPRLRALLRRIAAVARRIDRRGRADKRPESERVVWSHHVLSGRLMDAPTSRLMPSTRHRVPIWVSTPMERTPE